MKRSWLGEAGAKGLCRQRHFVEGRERWADADWSRALNARWGVLELSLKAVESHREYMDRKGHDQSCVLNRSLKARVGNDFDFWVRIGGLRVTDGQKGQTPS